MALMRSADVEDLEHRPHPEIREARLQCDASTGRSPSIEKILEPEHWRTLESIYFRPTRYSVKIDSVADLRAMLPHFRELVFSENVASRTLATLLEAMAPGGRLVLDVDYLTDVRRVLLNPAMASVVQSLLVLHARGISTRIDRVDQLEQSNLIRVFSINMAKHFDTALHGWRSCFDPETSVELRIPITIELVLNGEVHLFPFLGIVRGTTGGGAEVVDYRYLVAGRWVRQMPDLDAFVGMVAIAD